MYISSWEELLGKQMEPDLIKKIFESEDSLSQFCKGLTKVQAEGIYGLLYSLGIRYNTQGLERWRRSLQS